MLFAVFWRLSFPDRGFASSAKPRPSAGLLGFVSSSGLVGPGLLGFAWGVFGSGRVAFSLLEGLVRVAHICDVYSFG